MSDKWDAILSLAKGVSGVGGMFGGPFAQMAGQSDDVATAAMVTRELERQKKEQEKAEKGAKGRKLGSLVGGVAGAMIPGVGPLVSAGLSAAGSAAGGAMGAEAAGGDASWKAALEDALAGGISTYAGGKLMQGMQGANVRADALAEAGKAAPGSATKALNQGIANMSTKQMVKGGMIASTPWTRAGGALLGQGVVSPVLNQYGLGQSQASIPGQGGYSGMWSPYLDERYMLANQWGR